jgi:hypothetical protein
MEKETLAEEVPQDNEILEIESCEVVKDRLIRKYRTRSTNSTLNHGNSTNIDNNNCNNMNET